MSPFIAGILAAIACRWFMNAWRKHREVENAKSELVYLAESIAEAYRLQPPSPEDEKRQLEVALIDAMLAEMNAILPHEQLDAKAKVRRIVNRLQAMEVA